jgi:hypothetical protein
VAVDFEVEQVPPGDRHLPVVRTHGEPRLRLSPQPGVEVVAHPVPVDRVDDPDSKVDIVATSSADLRGVARLLGLGGLATGWIPVDRVRAAPDARRAVAPRTAAA